MLHSISKDVGNNILNCKGLKTNRHAEFFSWEYTSECSLMLKYTRFFKIGPRLIVGHKINNNDYYIE